MAQLSGKAASPEAWEVRARTGLAGSALCCRKDLGDVGLLGGFLRFIIWVLVATWIGRFLFGWLLSGAQRTAHAPGRPSARPQRRQLYRDPVCGTHVPEEIALTLEDSGQLHHFCSRECREEFAARLDEEHRSVSV